MKKAATSRSAPPGHKGGKSGGGDFDRLIAMLERMREILKILIDLKSPFFTSALTSQFNSNWPEVDKSFADAISALRDPKRRSQLAQNLEASGLSGTMLQMKETSLNDRLNRVQKEQPKPKAEKSKWKKFLRWVKPAFSVMNSVLGSLLKTFPGLEVAKEFKEHVEADYEVMETALED